ncbi:MAG: NF038122 family metalloprotease [Verrucomicrobia bacterium]|nr:NF038122 family metalloprotease [Verrucomicrobiota bacterium]
MNPKAILAVFVAAIAGAYTAPAQRYPAGVGAHHSLSNDEARPLARAEVPLQSTQPAVIPVPRSAAAATGSSGLIINATFDATITSQPNATAIESAINRAISIYQSLFRDPITVSILFRYASTGPDGSSVGRFLSESNYPVYPIAWNTYIGQLRADARTSNDSTANNSLPGSALSTNIAVSAANGRAVGLDTPPAMYANATIGAGGPYDGIVTINSNEPIQFTRPVAAGNYDGQRMVEHEIDEVLGLGSHLDSYKTADLRPEDLFSWVSPGRRSSQASDQRYFSINGGYTNLVSLNNDPTGDLGDWLSPACPQSVALVQYAFTCPGASTDVTATSPEAVSLDVIGYDLIPVSGGLLGNISTRLNVGTGNNVLIGGFVVGGSGSKQLVLRALGPTLAQDGVTNVLADPVLELHDSSGNIVAFNDNWMDAPNAASIPPNLRPSYPSESAILTSLNPGSYTAIVRGVNNTTGNALVEVYDISPNANAHLVNISSRGFVETDPDVMIAGTIVQLANERVIIRALGPTLASYGVTNPLADPTLELHDANGALLAANNNWKDTQEAEILATGYAPPNDLESAIVSTLAPGNYTAIVRGVNNTFGTALVEIYTLP